MHCLCLEEIGCRQVAAESNVAAHEAAFKRTAHTACALHMKDKQNDDAKNTQLFTLYVTPLVPRPKVSTTVYLPPKISPAW